MSLQEKPQSLAQPPAAAAEGCVCGCRQGDEAAPALCHVGRYALSRERPEWIPGPGKGEELRYQATEMASSWAGRTLSQRLNSHAISSLLLRSHGVVPVAQECSAL